MKKFWIFISIYSLFSALFIFNTSKVVNGERYFFIADDAFISMQYAKNFVQGDGFVWSVGEKVQGYTNPLWTMYMTIPHLLRIPQSKTPLFIQITAYLFMVMTLYLTWKLSFESIVVLIFTGFFLPLNYWFYSGMEVCILTFMCTLVFYLMIRRVEAMLIYALCGLMMWIRMDMILFFLLIIFINKRDWKIGLWMIILFIAILLQWNISYYNDWLPNTYYLKIYYYPLLWRLLRGTATLGINFFTMNWVAFVIILCAIPTAPVMFKRIIAFLSLEILYSLWIGGDAWEHMGGTNRFITLAMPLFFVSFVPSLKAALYRLRVTNKAVVFVIFALFFINFNMLMSKPKNLAQYFLPKDEIKIAENTLKIALTLREVSDDVVIATQGAGIMPYYSNKKYYIDLHGKCDRTIAHGKITGIHNLYDIFITAPGHVKYNQDYSIFQLKPDIIVHPIDDGKTIERLRRNYMGYEYKEIMKDVWSKI